MHVAEHPTSSHLPRQEVANGAWEAQQKEAREDAGKWHFCCLSLLLVKRETNDVISSRNHLISTSPPAHLLHHSMSREKIHPSSATFPPRRTGCCHPLLYPPFHGYSARLKLYLCLINSTYVLWRQGDQVSCSNSLGNILNAEECKSLTCK